MSVKRYVGVIDGAVAKYSDDQERDDNGRWVGGSGGGAAMEADSKASHEAAAEYHTRAAESARREAAKLTGPASHYFSFAARDHINAAEKHRNAAWVHGSKTGGLRDKPEASQRAHEASRNAIRMHEGAAREAARSRAEGR